MYTEDEAKGKWCPMTRVPNGGIGASAINSSEAVVCCASGCMMWRWRFIEEPPVTGFPDARGPLKKTGTGYCGLAGKP